MSALKKLQEARVKLQGLQLSKSGHNTYSNYYYFELGDFLPQTQTIFKELDLCGLCSFTIDLATLTITDTEDNSSVVITSPMGSASLKGCHEVQNIGAVETYQRRYLWMAAMEIVENDALDASDLTQNNGSSSKPAKQQSQKGNQDQEEKPWYNDFEKQKATMIERIASGTTADQIIKSLRDKYKLSKAIADQIKALEDA
jgi:hypothetical protein